MSCRRHEFEWKLLQKKAGKLVSACIDVSARRKNITTPKRLGKYEQDWRLCWCSLLASMVNGETACET